MFSIGPEALRTDIIVKTISVDMADEPIATQMEAILRELARQGIYGSKIFERPPDTRLASPYRRWKVCSDERLASLKTLMDQGKTEAEIAEALSMMEKQIRMGMRILRRRG